MGSVKVIEAKAKQMLGQMKKSLIVRTQKSSKAGVWKVVSDLISQKTECLRGILRDPGINDLNDLLCAHTKIKCELNGTKRKLKHGETKFKPNPVWEVKLPDTAHATGKGTVTRLEVKYRTDRRKYFCFGTKKRKKLFDLSNFTGENSEKERRSPTSSPSSSRRP